jgi:hypothetical protein
MSWVEYWALLIRALAAGGIVIVIGAGASATAAP